MKAAIEFTEAEKAIEVMKGAGKLIDSLMQRVVESNLQLSILIDYLQKHGVCRCENNGDYCEMHEMLFNAKQALKARP